MLSNFLLATSGFYLGLAAVGSGIIFMRKASSGFARLAAAYGCISFGLTLLLCQLTDLANALLILIMLDAAWLLRTKPSKAKPTRRKKKPATPHWYFFPRLLFVLLLIGWLLRAFLWQSIFISDSSMRPGLIVGDFILVNKYNYGIQLPIANRLILTWTKPSRGSIIALNDPLSHNHFQLRRIVALPGETIEYSHKKLLINGQPLNYHFDGIYKYLNDSGGESATFASKYREDLRGYKYSIIVDKDRPAIDQPHSLAFKNNCIYPDESSFICRVPPLHYFVLGDNRDNSTDSREWGFIGQAAIQGQASLIWMNWSNLQRITSKVY